MKLNLKLPKDPLQRFIDIYNELKKEHHFFDTLNCLRFASLASLTLPGRVEELVETIKIYSEDLTKQAGWLDSPHSPIRFIISSILVQYELSPKRLFDEVEHASKLFRAASLKNGHIYEKMAILLMKLQGDGKEHVSFDNVQRFKDIYDEMKAQSWWLTSTEYYPACAIMASLSDTPAEMAEKMKNIYDGLITCGFTSGKLLQIASYLLYISGIPVDVIIARFSLLAKTFEHHQIHITKADYTELAILSFLNQPVKQIVHSVMNFQDELRKLKPKPNVIVQFNLAAGITFFDLIQKNEIQQVVNNEESLLQKQQVLYAQQAAITFCAANCNALVIPVLS